MASLQELLLQRAELEKQIQSTQSKERSEAITKVKSLMAEYSLSVDDLAKGGRSTKADGEDAGNRTKSTKAGVKVAAKFRDPESGKTWSGRGLQPKWLKAAIEGGKTSADFVI